MSEEIKPPNISEETKREMAEFFYENICPKNIEKTRRGREGKREKR